jgi:hypothetical protein
LFTYVTWFPENHGCQLATTDVGIYKNNRLLKLSTVIYTSGAKVTLISATIAETNP